MRVVLCLVVRAEEGLLQRTSNLHSRWRHPDNPSQAWSKRSLPRRDQFARTRRKPIWNVGTSVIQALYEQRQDGYLEQFASCKCTPKLLKINAQRQSMNTNHTRARRMHESFASFARHRSTSTVNKKQKLVEMQGVAWDSTRDSIQHWSSQLASMPLNRRYLRYFAQEMISELVNFIRSKCEIQQEVAISFNDSNAYVACK